MNIHKPTTDFDFKSLTLETPQVLQDGSFFTKINQSEKPMYVQMPKCLTKDGYTTSKKGKYCDLLYSKEQEEGLISWLLSLESKCQNNIYDKRDVWFHNDLSKDDIETLMTPITRLFNSGKEILIRTYIDVSKQTGKNKCLVYGEDEIQIGLEDIAHGTFIIPLILVEGVKFTPSSFEILLKITQIMALDEKETSTNNCLIKRDDGTSLEPSVKTLAKTKQNNDIENVIVEQEPVVEQEPAMDKFEEDDNKSLSDNKHEVDNLDVANNDIEEINIELPEGEPINLKKPDEIYYEIYKASRLKAKHMRKLAIEAYLESKDIKTRYMLDDIGDSDDDSMDLETTSDDV